MMESTTALGPPARTMTRTALLLVALAFLPGCLGPRLFTNEAPRARFEDYRTYGFVEPIGTDDGSYGSLLSRSLKDAVAHELEGRGYEPSPNPDLLVNFYLHTEQKIRSYSTPNAFFGYRGYGWAAGTRYETVITQYTEATLSVDLVDRRKNEVVWEAALIGRIAEEFQARPADTAKWALDRVFEDFPYEAGSGLPRER